MKRAIILAGSLALAACGADRAYEEEDLSDYDGQEFAGETYEEFDARRDSYGGERGDFGRYDCSEDCSGHEAGYEWAEDNGIVDPDECGGNSWSFEEGCRAYAEDMGY